MSALKIVQIGLGPLGIKMIQFAQQRATAFEVVAGIDIDRATAERVGKTLNIRTWTSIGDAMKSARADVAILTTVSDIARIAPQVEEIVAAPVSPSPQPAKSYPSRGTFRPISPAAWIAMQKRKTSPSWARASIRDS